VLIVVSLFFADIGYPKNRLKNAKPVMTNVTKLYLDESLPEKRGVSWSLSNHGA